MRYYRVNDKLDYFNFKCESNKINRGMSILTRDK